MTIDCGYSYFGYLSIEDVKDEPQSQNIAYRCLQEEEQTFEK